MLLGKEQLLEYLQILTRNDLGEFIGLEQKKITGSKKEDLMEETWKKLKDNEVAQKQLFNLFKRPFAIYPLKVEEILAITKTERIRWTDENKLVVAYYQSFRKWGKNLSYPLYDAWEVLQVDASKIESWRQDHIKKVSYKKKMAAKKSAVTRKEYDSRFKRFYENEWKNMIKTWTKEDPYLSATLELSFWTMWLSRWAKEFQEKAMKARTKKSEYTKQKEKYYEMKNQAIELLQYTPFTKLLFYIPQQPNKVDSLHLCPFHYEEWVEERELASDYYGKWEYFYQYKNSIRECLACDLEETRHYYSLYYIEISDKRIPNFKFSFHTPYPIGMHFLPKKQTLENTKVHIEGDGMFRFGRPIEEEEKIIFKKAEVEKRFYNAVEKFKMYLQSQKDFTHE